MSQWQSFKQQQQQADDKNVRAHVGRTEHAAVIARLGGKTRLGPRQREQLATAQRGVRLAARRYRARRRARAAAG